MKFTTTFSSSAIPTGQKTPTSMRSMKSPRGILPYLPYITIGILVACAFISAYGMELLGDDLNHGMRTAEKFPKWYQWPLAIPYQWLTSNGRFGDMIGNILLAHSPKWLLASLSAIMEGLFYLMAIKIAFPGRNAVLPRLLVIATIMFAFPWWDSFFLFVCRINYIWSTALTLLTLWVTLFRQGKELNPWWSCLLIPIALMAGWGHEACGMPVAAGLLLYFCIGKSFKSLPKVDRGILIAFIIGCILSVTSPCSYSRLGAESIPDDTIPLLLVKSSFIALILLPAIAVTSGFSSGRKRIRMLCRTPWIVLVTAAICSMVFVAVGGIVGRSGLFSQIYALIALGLLLRDLIGADRICKEGIAVSLTSSILFLIMTAHTCGVCAYQIKSNHELKMSRQLYEASTDGVVYASPMQRNEFPWWTLCKNKACVDNDDYWLKEVYDLRLGQNKKRYRLLPEALRGMDINDVDSENKPESGWIEIKQPAGLSADNLLMRDGRQYIVVDFTSKSGQTLYYVAPRILDPGDR